MFVCQICLAEGLHVSVTPGTCERCKKPTLSEDLRLCQVCSSSGKGLCAICGGDYPRHLLTRVEAPSPIPKD